MIQKNLLGLLLSAGLFVLGFILNGNLGLYFNFSGILIVLGGTMAWAQAGYPIESGPLPETALQPSTR